MTEQAKPSAIVGAGFGLGAGIIFAMIEVAAAVMMGNPPLMPLRMFASVLLGQDALQAAPLGTAVLGGAVVHLGLSALYGLIFGLINAKLSAETQTSWGRQAGLGLLFGAMLWFVNFQIIARIFYPWFLTTPQFLQMTLHAMFFGLPLALMYAAANRRVRP